MRVLVCILEMSRKTLLLFKIFATLLAEISRGRNRGRIWRGLNALVSQYNGRTFQENK